MSEQTKMPPRPDPATARKEQQNMPNDIVAEEVVKVDTATMTVSARSLHAALEIKTAFKDWFPRMCEYGFTEGTDFCSKMSESTGGRPAMDYDISIDMAKEICMIQRTEIGRRVRKYFLDLERAWNTPDQIMARALRMADKTIAKLTGTVDSLRIENSQLTVDKQIMQPKADYFDELVDRNLLVNFTEAAKQLGVKRKDLIAFGMDHGYLYRDKKGNILPRANKKTDGLFEVKQCSNDKTGWAGSQTLMTPRGVETFRLLMQGM